MDESVRERIAIVRTKLLSKVPFMGHLCLKLEPIEMEEIPTMGVTQCRKLYYNPTFVSGLTDPEWTSSLDSSSCPREGCKTTSTGASVPKRFTTFYVKRLVTTVKIKVKASPVRKAKAKASLMVRVTARGKPESKQVRVKLTCLVTLGVTMT